MRKTLRRGWILGMAALLLVTFALGCAKHPSKEQLTKLDETKQAALAAEEQLKAKDAEKASLEKQLAAKQQELEKCQAEKKAVAGRLGK
jgi:septal ring factor EnvC (AmiA/AmiB activator)